MTAGVHDATAAEPATETDGDGPPCVDLGASIVANGEHLLNDLVVTSAEPEEHEAAEEASTGRQAVTVLGKPFRYGLNPTDSSLKTWGRFFDPAAHSFT